MLPKLYYSKSPYPSETSISVYCAQNFYICLNFFDLTENEGIKFMNHSKSLEKNKQ